MSARPRLFAELCCGSAAVTLRLLGGPNARPPISYQGSKRGYATAILGAMGLRSGLGADAVLLCDPGPWSRVWRVLSTPEGCRAVAATIRGWQGEEPRALWERLRKAGPLAGEDGAAQYVTLSNANRLINADWLDGVWQNTGKGGTTHGGEEFATPAGETAEAVSALESIRWPGMRIVDASAATIDPAEVAAWLWFSVRTMPQAQARGARSGDFLPMTAPAGNTRYSPSTPVEAVEAVEAVRWPPVGVTSSGAETFAPSPSADLSDCYVFIDPPYVGTTGYAHDLPRADVVEIAQRWAAAGAVVCISEAEPIEIPGWHALEITADRVGQKRTFSKQQREFLTLSRPPVVQSGTSLSLFGEAA